MFFPKDLNLSKKHVGGSKNVNIKKRPSHGETPLKIVEAGGIILKKKRSLLKLSDHSNEKLNKKNSKGHQIQSSHNKSFYLQNINNSQLSNPDIDSVIIFSCIYYLSIVMSYIYLYCNKLIVYSGCRLRMITNL